MKKWDIYWAYVKFDDKDGGKGRPVIIAEDNPDNIEPIICYKCTTSLGTKGVYQIEKWELAGLESRTAVILNKTIALTLKDFGNKKRKGTLRFCDIQKIIKKLNIINKNKSNI